MLGTAEESAVGTKPAGTPAGGVIAGRLACLLLGPAAAAASEGECRLVCVEDVPPSSFTDGSGVVDGTDDEGCERVLPTGSSIEACDAEG